VILNEIKIIFEDKNIQNNIHNIGNNIIIYNIEEIKKKYI